MRATTLLRRLLGLSVPVRSVQPDEDGAWVVELWVRRRPRCSRCGRRRPIHQTLGSRRWRHLDLGGRRCYLQASLRRVACAPCGGTFVEAVPWAEADADFTRPFEEWIGWLTQRCDQTTVSQLARVAWRTVGTIVARVVQRLRPAPDWKGLTAIGVDELSYRKGHRYLTLVTDLLTGRIVWSKEGRSADTLTAFFQEIGPAACARIEYAVIDMSEAYRQAIVASLPHVELVYDRFHVQQLLSRAVDEVRREEWRARQGSREGDALKRTRWALLKRPWNTTLRDDERLAGLARSNRRLYRAYLLKEALAGIYDRLLHPGWARRRLQEWLGWAHRSRLPPFLRVARTVRQHLEGILAYFRTGFTNGPAEGLNAKARLATRQAYGFHSAEAVRAMIDLRCTGLRIPLPHLG